MRHSRRALAVVGVLWLSALLPTAFAQDKGKGDKVRFESADGVDLHGTFYAGGRANAPTVLIVHAIGESSKKTGWKHLAEELQQKGFAVLAFDMRGHGLSDSITEPTKFYAVPANRIVKSKTLDVKDFPASYLPMLCNDIAAARAFLDRKNDLQACNTSSLIIVSAESGAALASIWLHSEWSRYRCKPPPPNLLPGMAFPLVIESNVPEANDVIACVWLSMNPKLQTSPKAAARSVDVKSLLLLPAKTKAVPMLFMHSDGDKKGKEYAQLLKKSLVGAGKEKGKAAEDDKYRFTAVAELPKSKLTGSDLLQKSLPTAQDIATYLKDVVEAKGQEWVERQFLKTPYAWKGANNTLYPANKIGEKTLNVKEYTKDYAGYVR